jgi:predicted HTH domain antitoxin
LPAALIGEEMVRVHDAAEIAGMSVDTMERIYGDRIIKVSPKSAASS